MSLRIVVVTGLYPTGSHPQRGMFVRDQVHALLAAGQRVTVAHREMPGLRGVARRLGVGAGAERGSLPSTSSAVADREPARRSRLRAAAGIGRQTHDTLGLVAAVAFLMRDLRRLERDQGRPDVLHAHNAFPAGVAALHYGQERGVPVVITEHSSAFLRGQHTPREVQRAAATYAAADAVVAVSARQADALPHTGVAVRVVPNIVPIHEFRLRASQAASTGSIISIGTLLPHKGMAQIVRAYAGLPEQVRAAHDLCLVGDGPLRPHLAALARGLGIEHRVRLTGHLDRAGVADELARASVLVSGSPVETFGITLVEGLSAGVPFVAPRSGGPQGIWTPQAGVLADGPDEQALRDALLGALALESSPAADQARRAQADARFGPAAVAAQLVEIYDDVRAARTS